MPVICQPLVSTPKALEGCRLWPRPTGISQVELATNTFGISPVEESRSLRRLKLSATGKLAIGPVRIEASKTEEAVSISFEWVKLTR